MDNLGIDEVWREVFERYIGCYKAIQLLGDEDVLDEEEKTVYEHNLLFNIIETFSSEVEE